MMILLYLLSIDYSTMRTSIVPIYFDVFSFLSSFVYTCDLQSGRFLACRLQQVDKSMNDDADSPSFAWQYFDVTCIIRYDTTTMPKLFGQ